MSTRNPLWQPQSEDDLRRAAAEGLLEETHYLDIKREISSGLSANKALAKDIAAFSLDGGIILIGIDEDQTPPGLSPIDTSNLAERIEQIARTRVDEPAAISTHVIDSDEHPGAGYLVITIPASPRAPHMAEGRYYGRGDKANQVLSHPEVLRLHERVLAARSDLAHEVKDLARTLVEGQALFGAIAEPQGPTDDLLVALTANPHWQQPVLDMITASTNHDLQRRFAPSVAQPSGFARRATGVAVTTGMAQGTRFTDPERDGAELVFEESGRLVLASQRAVTRWEFRNVTPTPDPVKVIFDDLIVGHLDLLVRAAGQVATRYGFTGTWRFAVALNQMRGASSVTAANDRFGDCGTTYSDDTYTRVAEASLHAISTTPAQVVESLIAPLLRSLGVYEHWTNHFGQA